MKRITRNNDRLTQQLINGMDSLSDAINDAIAYTIETPEQWDAGFGVTHRKNGEVVVGSFRNIVDEGNLQMSQDMTREGLSTTWEWDGNGETPVDLVYTGYTTANGRVPGRQFPERGIEKVNIGEEFEKGFNS